MRLITALRMLGLQEEFPTDHRDDCPLGSGATCECGFREIMTVLDCNVSVTTGEIGNLKEALQKYRVPKGQYELFLKETAHEEGYA